MADNTQLTRRAEKLGTAAKWGAGLLGAVIISPVVFLAVKGVVGLAIALGVGFTVTQLAPAFGMKVKNWRLKLIKAEARANPVETLQNVSIKKHADLQLFAQKISTFSGKVRSLDDKIIGLKQKFPEDAARFDEQSRQFHQLLETRKLKYRKAQDALEKFDHEIERARAVWDVALAARAVSEVAGGDAEIEALERIKAETAIDSVQDELNTQLGELEQVLLEEQEPDVKKLPAAEQRQSLKTNATDAEIIPVRRKP